MLGSHTVCSDAGVPIKHHHMAHSYCTVTAEGWAVRVNMNSMEFRQVKI